MHPFSAAPDRKPSLEGQPHSGRCSCSEGSVVLGVTCITPSVVLSYPSQRSRGASGSPMLPPIATVQQQTAPGAGPEPHAGHGTWTGASGEDFQGAQRRLGRSPPRDLSAELACAQPAPCQPLQHPHQSSCGKPWKSELSPCREGKGRDRKIHPRKERAALQAAD